MGLPETTRRDFLNATRIAIAKSDAGSSAYTEEAIDQAHRAVGELIASVAS